MNLQKSSTLNRVGKSLARPLGRIACSRTFHGPFRLADAYLNFIFGKGAGTGWDLEVEVRTAASRTYRRQPVVFDVGANSGSWSKTLLKILPEATILMFEPSPGCRQVIAEEAILAKAKLLPFAVGDMPGKHRLYFSSPTDGSASLHMRSDTCFSDRQYAECEVEVTTLDDVISREGLDFVDLVKMDIEGHEPFALKGAQQSIAARRIGALTFEFGSGNINSRTFFRDFWEVLSPAFRIWRIAPGGKLVLIDSYYEDLEYFRGVTNYIAELRDHPFALSGGRNGYLQQKGVE